MFNLGTILAYGTCLVESFRLGQKIFRGLDNDGMMLRLVVNDP